MHELSLAMSVREIVEDAAEKNGSKKVNEVNIIVGEFSSVSADALEFAMEVAKKGSVFENAKINIKSAKTILACSQCNGETVMEDYIFKCSTCGSTSVRIVSGDRMYVDSIDIEQ
ncbi:MAG TPA: hydrogenase maturation nickel metallochaperone HypA [Spirochaetota bacterium]|jgi:hydrogenase nickel incorporation protein HypA/HybF|nr:hydrogenase maturation nickel metallochaperone HypA [Spirochaetota bacterium]HPS85098.1 hydrogenase maturation nickel metallochaperone HypA [Spirochaetota bacterium]